MADSERDGRPFGRKPGAAASGTAIEDTISKVWNQLKTESARQNTSVFETSSVMAVSAARALPDGVRWLSASARVGATRTGQVLAAALLDHYRQTLSDIREVGYFAYANRQFRPYLRAAVHQFSPKRRTFTERLIEKVSSMRSARTPRLPDHAAEPDRPERDPAVPARRESEE